MLLKLLTKCTTLLFTGSPKPNVFLTPSGHAEQNFLTTIKILFDQFTTNGPFKPLALKLILIAGPLLLQKPSASSKSKDHVVLYVL